MEGKGLVVVDDNEKGLDHKTLKKSLVLRLLLVLLIETPFVCLFV